MARVLIVQEHLPHYRQRFFELVYEMLAARCIVLQLVYSPQSTAMPPANRLPWATPIPARRYGPFVWQNVCALAAGVDLVIVPQESKYLANYYLSIRSIVSGGKFAYWGHGKNFKKQKASILGERIKFFSSRFCDWWFTYNDLSATFVHSLGFPRERITSVQNSIDVRFITEAAQRVTPRELEDLRIALGIRGSNIAIFTGRLYPEKRLDFILASCQLVRQEIPDFELIIIGEGTEAQFVNEESKKYDWIHYVGAKNDLEKIPYWKLSKLLLMPGVVGLVVLDSFALGVPMVTTDCPGHGPEISYLQNGINGVIVTPWQSSEEYARRVAHLLKNSAELSGLKEGAIASAKRYSIEEMACNFVSGIEAALARPAFSRMRAWRKSGG